MNTFNELNFPHSPNRFMNFSAINPPQIPVNQEIPGSFRNIYGFIGIQPLTSRWNSRFVKPLPVLLGSCLFT